MNRAASSFSVTVVLIVFSHRFPTNVAFLSVIYNQVGLNQNAVKETFIELGKQTKHVGENQ